MAKVALVGASGNVGSRILKELSARGHQVTAIARHPDRIAALAGVKAVAGDAGHPQQLAPLLAGHDVVITSIMFLQSDADQLIQAVRQSGAGRYIVVGGAGSLEVAPGLRLIDTPEFPEIYKAEASKGADFLDRLRATSDLDWTFLSPSAYFFAGERTGTFRLAGDSLLVKDGQSSISYEDYAVALVDEIEQPRHRKQRFTVGY